MATRLEPRRSQLYGTDFHAWAHEQADLLRAGRLHELDLEHLIEEVDDLGESLHRSVRSRVRTIIEHLLKLEHSPSTEPRRGWRATTSSRRRDLDDDMTASLRSRIEADLQRHYERARGEAQQAFRDHGGEAAANALPEACPYTLDQIIGDWWP